MDKGSRLSAPSANAPREWRALIDSVPEERRAILRTALEQWHCAMWLASVPPDEWTDGRLRDSIEAPVLEVHMQALEAVLGCGVRCALAEADTEAATAFARALGELGGSLARLTQDALDEVASELGTHGSQPDSVRTRYGRFVDAWESRYRDWMLTAAFSRLQGELINGALTLRGGSGCRP
jgi:hypothetical protein